MTDTMLSESLASARKRLARALYAAERPAAAARLLAVSKTKPAAMIRAAWALGQREFGESYVQEALEKQDELRELNGIIWQFIGPFKSKYRRDRKRLRL